MPSPVEHPERCSTGELNGRFRQNGRLSPTPSLPPVSDRRNTTHPHLEKEDEQFYTVCSRFLSGIWKIMKNSIPHNTYYATHKLNTALQKNLQEFSIFYEENLRNSVLINNRS